MRDNFTLNILFGQSDTANANASAFWCNGPVGLLQHPDFWDTIAKKVNIHRSDIQGMTVDSVQLEDSLEVPCDAILCGT